MVAEQAAKFLWGLHVEKGRSAIARGNRQRRDLNVQPARVGAVCWERGHLGCGGHLSRSLGLDLHQKSECRQHRGRGCVGGHATHEGAAVLCRRGQVAGEIADVWRVERPDQVQQLRRKIRPLGRRRHRALGLRVADVHGESLRLLRGHGRVPLRLWRIRRFERAKYRGAPQRRLRAMGGRLSHDPDPEVRRSRGGLGTLVHYRRIRWQAIPRSVRDLRRAGMAVGGNVDLSTRPASLLHRRGHGGHPLLRELGPSVVV
mmetsp:Transcript_168715/g.542177  ORF Transcript_168715/g.542177 Transcript_168715/m.542177 type:complete len:259 (+) Transcript_168715:987-1763(+)